MVMTVHSQETSPQCSRRFEHKRVLITGATGAIGSALARAFHEEGAHVCLSGRDADLLEILHKELPESSAFLCSLTDEGATAKLARDVESQGPVDVLINNAGITKDQISLRMNDDSFREVIETNLVTVFSLSREILKGMMRRKAGSIIMISSVVAVTGNPGQANYVASKAGLIGLTKTLALEFARLGITVNAIAPGYIQSPMTDSMSESARDSFLSRVPMGTIGMPHHVARAALFLAEADSYITGQTLHINGGLSLI